MNARHRLQTELLQMLGYLGLWHRLIAFALGNCLQDCSKDDHDELRDNMDIQVRSILLHNVFDFQRQILQWNVCHL